MNDAVDRREVRPHWKVVLTYRDGATSILVVDSRHDALSFGERRQNEDTLVTIYGPDGLVEQL